MCAAIVGLVTAFFLPETANRPLRGDTPSASNKKEARLLLQEAYSNIEQRVEAIDAEILVLEQQIEELQLRRQSLVDRHPKLS